MSLCALTKPLFITGDLQRHDGGRWFLLCPVLQPYRGGSGPSFWLQTVSCSSNKQLWSTGSPPASLCESTTDLSLLTARRRFLVSCVCLENDRLYFLGVFLYYRWRSSCSVGLLWMDTDITGGAVVMVTAQQLFMNPKRCIINKHVFEVKFADVFCYQINFTCLEKDSLTFCISFPEVNIQYCVLMRHLVFKLSQHRFCILECDVLLRCRLSRVGQVKKRKVCELLTSLSSLWRVKIKRRKTPQHLLE